MSARRNGTPMSDLPTVTLLTYGGTIASVVK